METGGIFLTLIGAVVLFAADWQDWPVFWMAALLFLFAGMVGFAVKRWRFPMVVILALSPVAAEWSSQHLKVFSTELSATAPNLAIIAIVAFVLAYTASLMGGGLRSFVDVGTR